MSRNQTQLTDFHGAYQHLKLDDSWKSDFLFDHHVDDSKQSDDRVRQAVSVLRAISLSVVCGQHFLLNIDQESPTTAGTGETKTDSSKEIDLIVGVVRGHANVSNGIAHLVFTKDTTCEQLVQVAHKGQIFIAIDVHLASPRVVRALSEIMSLRATPTNPIGNTSNGIDRGMDDNNRNGHNDRHHTGSHTTTTHNRAPRKQELDATDTNKFVRHYSVIAVSRGTRPMPYAFRCLFMLSIPVDDVKILKFAKDANQSTQNNGFNGSKTTKGNRMDQLISEFERLSKLVHVSTHLRNYVDNIRIALTAHPLIRRGPSYKRLSMSHYQRQRGTHVTMDGDVDGLRVMAVICANEYLLPRHIKMVLPDLLSHRLELHEFAEEDEEEVVEGGREPRTSRLRLARAIVQEVIHDLPPVMGEHPRR